MPQSQLNYTLNITNTLKIIRLDCSADDDDDHGTSLHLLERQLYVQSWLIYVDTPPTCLPARETSLTDTTYDERRIWTILIKIIKLTVPEAFPVAAVRHRGRGSCGRQSRRGSFAATSHAAAAAAAATFCPTACGCCCSPSSCSACLQQHFCHTLPHSSLPHTLCIYFCILTLTFTTH